jgi:NADH-quinone oxidoreductase subunit C
VVDLVETGRDDRFLVYALVYSMGDHRHARLQATTDETIGSLTPLFAGAHNYEREAFDLFGVRFDGHPELTRIMLPDAWQGHPMRRDAPNPTEPVDFTVTRALYNT